jgi:hypothetical protein
MENSLEVAAEQTIPFVADLGRGEAGADVRLLLANIGYTVEQVLGERLPDMRARK